jgi:cytochrome c oxidase subunit 1
MTPPRTTYLNVDRSVRSWLLTLDHKRIGVMFLCATTLFLLVGGLFALLLRIELAQPGLDIMDAATYNRLFTLHGVVMVFLFMIPAIPAGFGNFVLPIMIGATEVAFPRLNLTSFYLYVLGAIVALAGLFIGGADTGWTFYVPYSAETSAPLIPVLIGVFIVGWSSILTGFNFITTVHMMRTKNLGWHKMPLFVWTIYGTSIIQVVATPVLGMVLVLISLDNGLDLGIFDPDRGGDPILYQHLFWFYSHPAVYIMVLPAMGVISETVCTFSHKNPLSYRAIAYSTLGIAFVGFLGWGHHMFTSGMSVFGAGTFSVLSMLIAIFSAIKTFNWVGTMYRGSVELATPFAYVLGFLFLFVFGGMTGVAVATSSLDVHWHDTYFIVAHFHFIMVGGTISAFLAAAHYWFPKITGKMYSDGWGLAAAALVFVGFLVTFTPQFLLGNSGMPRRYATYPEHFQALNAISTGGALLLAIGLALALITLVVALLRGKPAGPNPWRSASYEWSTPNPPPPHNFEDGTPEFASDPSDYTRAERPVIVERARDEMREERS